MRFILAILAVAATTPAFAQPMNSGGLSAADMEAIDIFEERAPDPDARLLAGSIQEFQPQSELHAAVAGTGKVIRLTPEQSEQAIDAGAARRAAQENAGLDLEQEARSSNARVHGEAGMMVGSGGARGVYGAAEAPIGDNGFATFEYENVSYGRRHGRP